MKKEPILMTWVPPPNVTIDWDFTECGECGAIVRDWNKHRNWHELGADHVDEPTSGVPR
jgi:hypothetical protein